MAFTGKPLTAEQARIVRAAASGRLRTNEHGRWVIAGEERPERKPRERLAKRGLIAWQPGGAVIATAAGLAALASHDAHALA